MKRLLLAAAAWIAASSASAQTMNAERYWTMTAGDSSSSCTASAQGGSANLILAGVASGISFGLAGPALPTRPRTLELRLDRERLTFPPVNTGGLIMPQGAMLSSSAILSLRKAQTLAVIVDGDERLKLDLANSGTMRLIDDLLDCSLGKSGWWGAGAALPGAPKKKAAAAGPSDSLLPPAPPGAKPGSIPMGPAGSR